jgi:hypothetical protein
MDTAHPIAGAETDPNAQLASAADAFKAFTSGDPVRPRDEQGRFASQAEEPTEDLAEVEEGEEPELTEADDEDAQEAAEEPAQPMPPSWPADQAEHWNALPPETREYISAREGERERAVQAKFQEAAIARKEATLEAQEAANNRKQLIDAYQAVEALINPTPPDPRAFGAGTGQYNREAYDLAVLEYQEQLGIVQGLQAQRQALAEQAMADERNRWTAQKQEIETAYQPRLLADVPELRDPAKGETVIRSLIDYAVQAGIPADTFAPEEQDYITSAQLHILWKAQQYDALKTKAPAPKPKQAGPVVRPGVSSPRSAQKVAQRSREFDRLTREGSIEAGAAVFKHFLK